MKIISIILTTLFLQAQVSQAAYPDRVQVKKIEQKAIPTPSKSEEESEIQTRISFNVPTSGCTDESSFKIEVVNLGSYSQVQVQRIQEDECKGFFPEGLDIVFETHEVDLKQEIQFLHEGIPVKIQ